MFEIVNKSKRIKIDNRLSKLIQNILFHLTHFALIIEFLDIHEVSKSINFISKFHSNFIYLKTSKLALKTVISNFYNNDVFNNYIIKNSKWDNKNNYNPKKLIKILFDKYKSVCDNFGFEDLWDFCSFGKATCVIYWARRCILFDCYDIMYFSLEFDDYNITKILSFLLHEKLFKLQLHQFLFISKVLCFNQRMLVMEYFIDTVNHNLSLKSGFINESENLIYLVELLLLLLAMFNYLNFPIKNPKKALISNGFNTFYTEPEYNTLLSTLINLKNNKNHRIVSFVKKINEILDSYFKINNLKYFGYSFFISSLGIYRLFKKNVSLQQCYNLADKMNEFVMSCINND